jgi:hypothetical protein
MSNDNQVVVTQSIDGNAYSNLVATRNNLVKGLSKTGDLIQGYADNMCMVFNLKDTTGKLMTPWFELKGKAKAGVKAEKEAFAKACADAGFKQGTIDVYWQRVKEASGYVTAGNRVKGGSSTDDKTKAELKTMINRILASEENGEDCKASDIKRDLMNAYEFMGGDVEKDCK